MAWKHLGESFDIHGGGIDLVFPHHENEIAQSRCAFHRPVMANYWLHNGFVQMEGDKMSKSVGNIVKIREALADWPGEVIRLNMLRTHYRQPIDWTVRGLEESWRILDEWYATAADAPEDRVSGRVLEALTDDLNTPEAITALHALRNLAQGGDKYARDELATSLRFLGLLRDTAVIWEARKQVAKGIDPGRVEALIEARNAARKAKDFAEADRIRGELSAMGVEIRDSKDGTTWEVAT
jgi:cysteinyl-tRNA synthetase